MRNQDRAQAGHGERGGVERRRQVIKLAVRHGAEMDNQPEGNGFVRRLQVFGLSLSLVAIAPNR